MKDSLKWLLSKFPSFLDKSKESNFYKSTSVINESFKEFRNDLFRSHLSHRLNKKVLIWKEQSAEKDYSINFFVNIPYLKMVNCYKNDTLIYSESYEYADEVDTFIYSYDGSSDNVIPDDKFHITVETWEEYVLAKGFPENDTVVGDMFDHDSSLDDFGALYDIPRKQYTYTESTNYANTEPPYNNRLTEDDYHYMNRILGYISHMLDTPLPVLEVWKLFGIDLSKITLINRERYLCKMYSAVKHGGDDWEPYPWEHKDPMGCYFPEPVYFFVEVDNHSPVYGQDILFNFTFMNMYGEDKGKDYLIDVYLDDELIASGVDPISGFMFDTHDVDDSKPLIFKFVANPLDERLDVLESDEIIITVKGCNTADWYVSVDGSDDNLGTMDNPFATLGKALSMVEGSRNVIVLVEGTFYISNSFVIDSSTSIISCRGATIRNDMGYDFFRVLPDCTLYLQGVTLKHKCCEMYGVDDSFINRNLTSNPVYLRINPDIMCKPPVVIGVDSLTSNMYAHSNMEVTGTLLSEKTSETVTGEVIELCDSTGVLDTDTTDENGEYSFSHRLDSLGLFSFILNHEESLHYCMGETSFNVNVTAMPTVLNATMDSLVLVGDELTIAYSLLDYYGHEVLDGNVELYEDNILVATVDAGEEFEYTPSSVGTHTYKLVFDCDETYIASESETFTVVVRRYETNLALTTSKDVYEVNETVSVTGVLTDELGNNVANATVKLYDDNSLIYTGVTNNNGTVVFESDSLTVGKHTLQYKYNQSSKYEACISNAHSIRIKENTLQDINLYLYPSKKIGVTGTSIGLNVYATDKNGDPISTSFKLIDTYSSSCGEYPVTTYTTGNDGWWTGSYSTDAIVKCHGIYIQAVSTVDELYYSNVAHIFDEADPVLSVTGDLYSTLSLFDKDTASLPLSVLLLDSEEEPLPNESFSIQLVSDGVVESTVTGTTNVLGEAELNVSVPSSVKGKDLTVRLVYNGRTGAYASASDSVLLHYVFSPVLTLTSSKSVYIEGQDVVLTGLLMDEFNNPLTGKSVKLYQDDTLIDTLTTDGNGAVSKTVTGLSIDEYTFSSVYDGATYYHSAESSDLTVEVIDGKLILTVTGDSFTLGSRIVYSGQVNIDWGDGTVETNVNPNSRSHTYTDGESSHIIIVTGEITRLGDYCFHNCSGLTSVTIPDSVTSLGISCFSSCPGLTSVTISDSVTSLGRNCFMNCISLSSVVIPNSVTSIGNYCFYGCYGLISVTIPDSLTSLGEACFAGCSGLISVTIPDSLTRIGDDCFKDCSGLIDYELYWESNIITYSSSKMLNNTNTIFTIPVGTKADYITAGYPSNKLLERGTILSVTSDKEIIQKTETATITALLENNGTGIGGETLSYSIVHDGTTIDSGTVTTDSDGEAEITYTGTGVGEVNITVSYGIFLQETFVVTDTYKYDNATSDSHNDIWSVTGILERKTEYSELSESTVGTTAHCTISNISLTSYRVEFDVYQVDGSKDENCCIVYNSSWSPLYSVKSEMGNWKHISFDMTDIASNSRFRIGTLDTTTVIRFKNFKIYPI